MEVFFKCGPEQKVVTVAETIKPLDPNASSSNESISNVTGSFLSLLLWNINSEKLFKVFKNTSDNGSS